MNHSNSSPLRVAAFDFGSNSFHVAVAEIAHGQAKILLRDGERVQLALGISDRKLSTQAISRALACVQRFAGMVQPLQPQLLRAVATHAVRIVDNAADFLVPARQLLQLPVEVISGEEEARLIYRAVRDEFPANPRRVVIDIGGGSTELVLGQGDHIELCDSLDLGCLTLKERAIESDGFNPRQFARAVEYAMAQLAPMAARYALPQSALHIGTSGTLQTIAGVLHQHLGQPEGCITSQALLSLPRELARFGNASTFDLKGLDQHRRSVFVSGLAIVTALFVQFNIAQLHIAQADLRDGVLLGLAEQCNIGLQHPLHAVL